jgi:hypothetical protein
VWLLPRLLAAGGRAAGVAMVRGGRVGAEPAVEIVLECWGIGLVVYPPFTYVVVLCAWCDVVVRFVGCRFMCFFESS